MFDIISYRMYNNTVRAQKFIIRFLLYSNN